MPHPGHRPRTRLVAALRHEIEEEVAAQKRLGPAREGGIGVEDVAGRILVEDTDTRRFLAREAVRTVVIVDVALGEIFRRERYVKVVVEVAAMRRYPREVPAHALPERLDLRER